MSDAGMKVSPPHSLPAVRRYGGPRGFAYRGAAPCAAGGEMARPGRSAPPAPRQTPIWMTSFTDVMGLMLTFFVMMFAMAEPEVQSWSDIRSALNSELNKFPDAPPDPGPVENTRPSRAAYDRALDLRYLDTLMENIIGADQNLTGARLVTADGALLVSFPQGALFAPDGITVSPAGRSALSALAERLGRVRNRIEIVAYVDSLGDPAAGWALSLARAAQVAAQLRSSGYERPVDIKGRAAAPGGLSPSQGGGQVNIVIKNHGGQSRELLFDLEQP